jgi:hypothetical protein
MTNTSGVSLFMSNELCVYCKEQKSREEFDREHVVPESFGKFKNNWTLHYAVCKKCNSYFSKELELFLGRDSLFGLMRYRFGLAQFDKKKWRYGSRVRLELDDPRLGDWNGAIVELVPPRNNSQSNPDVILIPQAAFLKKEKNTWVHFPIDKIPPKEQLIEQGFDLTKYKILGNSEDDIEKAKQKASHLGIDTNRWIDLSSGQTNPKLLRQIRVNVQSKIDSIILRSMAKIGFNYLAKIQGKTFVLASHFDDIREFIRFGRNQNRGLVTVAEKPLLNLKRRPSRKIVCHVIILDWADPNFLGISCRVSLFNYLTFLIKLCKSFKGIIRPVFSGHLYNLKSKEVIKLNRTSILN